MKNVLRDLYDALEKIRYPEVAQTRFEEFESTILTDAKRSDLLQWILEECPSFSSFSLNKIKDNAMNDKLFKSYSQMGFCNDESILFGKCPIEKQLNFLSLLTVFMKSVHFTENETTKNDKKAASPFIIIQLESENIDPNKMSIAKEVSDSTVKEFNKDENHAHAQTEAKTEELTNSSNNSNPQIPDCNKFDEICLAIKENTAEILSQKTEDYESILEKSNSSFKMVTSISTQDKSSNAFSDYGDLPQDLDKIHSTFSIVNKTLNNKSKVRNEEIPENLSKVIKPLTEAIKNNLVLIEQASNLCTEN